MPNITPATWLTYEDLLNMPDDGLRYELFEGELVVTPAPGYAHQNAVFRLGRILLDHVEVHSLGNVVPAPFDVRLSDITVVEPDLLFIPTARLPEPTAVRFDGPPELIVEFLSPTTADRDQGAKKKLYAQYGVPHYWIGDPTGRWLRACSLDQGAYTEVAFGKDGDAFSAPPFPDLVIDLAQLWA